MIQGGEKGKNTDLDLIIDQIRQEINAYDSLEEAEETAFISKFTETQMFVTYI